MPSAQIRINLLPKDPFLSTPLGKLLRWATTAGRYLVIFTELIVVLCFASRFTLDRQITDLNTSILQKRVIIESYGDLEKNVRSVQQKIEQYSQIEPQTNLADTFPKLISVIPPEVRLERLTILPNSISFSGKATSQDILNGFIRNLQGSTQLTNVEMSAIDIGTLQQVTGLPFKVQADLATTPLKEEKPIVPIQ